MVLDRLRRKQRRAFTVERHPDDLPKHGLFTEPVRVSSIDVAEPQRRDDGAERVAFLVEVRDADDKRCAQFSVEARMSGPSRTRTVSGTTDLLGRIRFRMADGPGEYTIEITDVAAGGLEWDRQAGPTTATATLP